MKIQSKETIKFAEICLKKVAGINLFGRFLAILQYNSVFLQLEKVNGINLLAKFLAKQ